MVNRNPVPTQDISEKLLKSLEIDGKAVVTIDWSNAARNKTMRIPRKTTIWRLLDMGLLGP